MRKYHCRQYNTEYQKIIRIPFQLSYFYSENSLSFSITHCYTMPAVCIIHVIWHTTCTSIKLTCTLAIVQDMQQQQKHEDIELHMHINQIYGIIMMVYIFINNLGCVKIWATDTLIRFVWFGLWCLAPLATIFQLYLTLIRPDKYYNKYIDI